VKKMAEKICEVPSCGKLSFKTVPAELAKKVFPAADIKNKMHLCKDHYKEYKKGTKEEREVRRMDWV
jgi:hypothetical protein